LGKTNINNSGGSVMKAFSHCRRTRFFLFHACAKDCATTPPHSCKCLRLGNSRGLVLVSRLLCLQYQDVGQGILPK